MVAIVRVINETIAIVETVIVPTLLNISTRGERFAWRSDKFSRPPPLELILLDIPALSEDHVLDPYAMAFIFPHQSNIFEVGFVDVSYDDGDTWDEGRAEIKAFSTVGMVVENGLGDRELGDPRSDRWDVYSQVTVEMFSGILESKTRAEVLSGANLVLINNEIRAFANAVEIVSTTIDTQPGIGRMFELTDWIRGMRGTKPVETLPGFILVDLNGPHIPVRIPNGDDGVELRYRARSKRDPDNSQGFKLTILGENLRPFSPGVVSLIKDATTGDWAIKFSPVTRNPNPQIFSARGIVDLDTGAWVAEIMSDGTSEATVKRSIAVTQDVTIPGQPVFETSAYSDADQVTDFGSTQATIFIRLSQTGTWLDGIPTTFRGTS